MLLHNKLIISVIIITYKNLFGTLFYLFLFSFALAIFKYIYIQSNNLYANRVPIYCIEIDETFNFELATQNYKHMGTM